MAGKQSELLELLKKASELSRELQGDQSLNPIQSRQATALAKEVLQNVELLPEQALNIFMSTFLLPASRTALDAKWLEAIVQAGPGGIAVEQLAKQTDTSPTLAARLLRYLASRGIIAEVGINTYAATALTRFLTIPSFSAGLRHFSNCYPAVADKLPEFLAKHKYQEPDGVSADLCTYTRGQPFFSWVSTRPDAQRDFDIFMSATRAAGKKWLDYYPLDKFQDVKPGQVLLVDVGGGRGHDLNAFALAMKTRGLQGKLVLQDRPEEIEHTPAEWKQHFEATAHDFFTPQPVKGARAYFLKTVLHDWPDSACLKILGHIRDAMTPHHSSILIDETILPDQGCYWIPATLDICMMSVLSGKERSRRDWEELIGKVDGLKLEKIWNEEGGWTGVVEVRRVE